MSVKKALDQVDRDAMNIVLGYCCKEIYVMGLGFPVGHFMNVAAHRFVEACGMSWPQFTSEFAETLGKVDVRDFDV